ncbi:CAP domain-containing protein [Actinomadura parmotrematis]|uniref:CAP domain-containing protein n=1 Tax=Actinomadura parmotrematis TaxID=2864039 RepID=A0ABS7G4Q0_9ACTN|nr:CAP domain-containing protein [Actinomadura parmotrematis]MBW8487451.1 CAP domain-containing protein [Actinomadura parmotrematis]
MPPNRSPPRRPRPARLREALLSPSSNRPRPSRSYPDPYDRPGPYQRGDSHDRGDRRRRGRSALAVTAAVAGAALAAGTGVLLNGAVSPGPSGRPAAALDGRQGSDAPDGGAPAASPASSSSPAPSRRASAPADQAPPPLKRIHVPAPRTASPTPSTSPGGSSGGGDSGTGGGGGGTPAAGTGSTSTEAAVASLTNSERAKAGCPALRVDARLVTAARKHSADMAAHNYFDHNSQDGTTPWTRMERAGYSDPGAENIAMGYATAAAVMKGWMNSPGHRANILNCKLRAIGVGRAGSSRGPYWTQDFGWS